MSNIPPSFDPYAPPQGEDLLTPSSQPSLIPPTLKAICIIAAVLGGLGLFGAMIGAGGLAVGQLVNRVTPAFPSAPAGAKVPPELEAQQQIQERMQATAHQYLPWNILLLIIQFLAALSLLIGGLMALKLNPTGRKLLVIASLVACIYVISATALYIMIQAENAGLFREMVQNMPGRAAGPMGTFPKIMSTMLYVGIIFTLALSLVKLSFYIITVVYMGKQPIKALYERADSSLVERPWTTE